MSDKQVQNRLEKLITLKAVPLFEELEIDSLLLVSQITQYEKFPAHEIVIEENGKSDKFYIIISGGVEVLKKAEKITSLIQGEIFGELGVIDNSPRTTTIKTLTETLFLVIHQKDFLDLMKKNGTIAFCVTKTLSNRLRKTLHRVSQTDL